MTSSPPPTDPGSFLNVEQSRRLWCLSEVLRLVAGRSVHMSTVMEIARWLYNGEGSS